WGHGRAIQVRQSDGAMRRHDQPETQAAASRLDDLPRPPAELLEAIHDQYRDSWPRGWFLQRLTHFRPFVSFPFVQLDPTNANAAPGRLSQQGGDERGFAGAVRPDNLAAPAVRFEPLQQQAHALTRLKQKGNGPWPDPAGGERIAPRQAGRGCAHRTASTGATLPSRNGASSTT